MKDYIGPFDVAFTEALTVRREASLLRGWAMPWNEDVPLPGSLARDQNQERTEVLRRQLQLTDGEIAMMVDAGEADNVQEVNVDQEMPAAFIQLDDESEDEADGGPAGQEGFVLDDDDGNVQGQVRMLGYTSEALATANVCSVCMNIGASVAVVGCGCVCICRECAANGDLPLKACPICRGGSKDGNGRLVLQRLH
jgi:Zinc finger, C3HC4 type (RING finger)